MQRLIFGNEDAHGDNLLHECPVYEQVPDEPIVTGRWGSGKTASLFIKNRDLIRRLRTHSELDKLAWYIDEDKLDIQALLALRKKYEDDPKTLRSILEEVWTADILRHVCILLAGLWHYFGSPRGNHWDAIFDVGCDDLIGKSVWKHFPMIARIILGGSERTTAIDEMHSTVERLLQEQTYEDIQKCLRDVKMECRPVIAIDPIDSPTSSLEGKPGLAQPLLTALLNVFRRKFQPSDDQLIQVNVSVPWHRIDVMDLDAPSKLPQYIGPIQWNRKTLRTFINRRIQWEFKRIGRGISSADAWSVLFAEKVQVESGVTTAREKSFDFVLRHTHHCPRDVQRIARECVNAYAKIQNLKIDEALMGKGARKIGGEVFRETVAKATDNMAKALHAEGNRRFEFLNRIIESLKGIKVPFTIEDLANETNDICQINTALLALWESGIIGITISTFSPRSAKQLKTQFGAEPYHQYKMGNRIVHVWSLFFYNWDGDYLHIVDSLNKQQYIEAGLILHPKMFRYLGAHIISDWPLGA